MAVALASPRGGRGDKYNAYRKALAIAGKDIASALSPASNSLHESALHNVRGDYKLNSMDGVNHALEQDLIRHRAKYVATPSASALPSVDSARFTVDLPTSPQHQKYCWAPKRARAADRMSRQTSAFSRQISTVLEDVDDVFETEDSPMHLEETSRRTSKASYAGIRSSMIATHAIEGLVQEQEAPISERDQAIASILTSNRMNLDSLEKTFEDLDQDKSGIISRRAVAIRLTQKLLGPNASVELQTPVFNFLKRSCIEFDKSTQTLTKERFIDFCRHAGLMIEYKTDSPQAMSPTESQTPRTPRMPASALLCS